MKIDEKTYKYIVDLITKQVILQLKKMNFIIEPDFSIKKQRIDANELGYYFKEKVLTEEKLRRLKIRDKIFINKKTIVTPSAKDYCLSNNIQINRK